MKTVSNIAPYFQMTEPQNEVQYFGSLTTLKQAIDSKITSILNFLGENDIKNVNETVCFKQQKFENHTNNKNKWFSKQKHHYDNLDAPKARIGKNAQQRFENRNIQKQQQQYKQNNYEHEINQLFSQLLNENPTKILKPQSIQQLPQLAKIQKQYQTAASSKHTSYETENNNDAANNQFINLRINEDGSDPTMWIYKTDKHTKPQQQQCQSNESPQLLLQSMPIQLKHCVSISDDNHSEVDGFSILQVPQEQSSDEQIKSNNENLFKRNTLKSLLQNSNYIRNSAEKNKNNNNQLCIIGQSIKPNLSMQKPKYKVSKREVNKKYYKSPFCSRGCYDSIIFEGERIAKPNLLQSIYNKATHLQNCCKLRKEAQEKRKENKQTGKYPPMRF